MAAETGDTQLLADLRTLGRAAVPEPDADALTRRVLAVVPATARAGRARGSTRRRLVLAVAAVLLALLATPPVRATVADWFGFGGVRVEPGPSRPGGDPLPPVRERTDVDAAAASVRFPLVLPSVLGSPDAVAVSGDRRVVSMGWTDPAQELRRVDQFDGTLDFAFAKQVPRLQFVTVAGTDALWFPAPHSVVLLEADGTRRTESARTAGPSLVWPMGTTTFRLEGRGLSLAEAVAIAESAEPVG